MSIRAKKSQASISAVSHIFTIRQKGVKMDPFTTILDKKRIDKHNLMTMLAAEGKDKIRLFEKANAIKAQYWGNDVHIRGIIEFSNKCRKNCLYCGIRSGNTNIHRYSLSDEQILEIVKSAIANNISSIVLQSGEIASKQFAIRIEQLLKQIKRISNGTIGITLSLGEQSKGTYQRWFDAGAHRYLLRIETSNKDLYTKIHPNNKLHDYGRRKEALWQLHEIGYQTGTGVMIGLPSQTIEDLANDILFYKQLDIDMCGMGPYIEHRQTPMYSYKDALLPLPERLELTLKMIAATRIFMQNINLAASTALDAIDADGRNRALCSGANILMPNITPSNYCPNYKLYENKPTRSDSISEYIQVLNSNASKFGYRIIWNKWGDSIHYAERTTHK